MKVTFLDTRIKTLTGEGDYEDRTNVTSRDKRNDTPQLAHHINFSGNIYINMDYMAHSYAGLHGEQPAQPVLLKQRLMCLPQRMYIDKFLPRLIDD